MSVALDTYESFSETEILASICRDSYWEFIKEFWDEVPSAAPLEENWHMELLAQEMQIAVTRIWRGESCAYDSVFNVPFGTSKSTICSILFQPWVWTFFPQFRQFTGTHTDSLAVDLSSKSKSVMESEKYQEVFPHVKFVKKADSNFSNTFGGERRICTVGGKTPTGFHVHAFGVDDAIDPKGARSEAELLNARHFMVEVIPSRKVNKITSWTYLVMQKLCKGDPADVMVGEGKKEGAIPVRRICLPGELSDDVWPPVAELRKQWPEAYENGLLDERRLPRVVLKQYLARGVYFYGAQIMQNPQSLGGAGMFKDTHFNQRCKAAPFNSKRIRYWDRASTEDGGCATAGVLMAKGPDGNYYVEHIEYGHWEPDERNRKMRAVALRDRQKYGPNHEPVIWIEAEGGSSGRDSWKMAARALEGFAVHEDHVTGSKDTRAEPFAAQCAALNVSLVEDGTWDVNGYLEELVNFKPDLTSKRLGRKKDRVDGSSGAFNKLVGERALARIRVLSSKPDKIDPKAPRTRIVVCSTADMQNFIIEDKCLFVSISDPEPGGGLASYPQHGLDGLVDKLKLTFLDIEPKDYQDKWEQPIAPYDKCPKDLMMSPADGKKFWAFLTRKRQQSPTVLVFQDEGDRRALSLAMGVCEIMRIPRDITIECLDGSDTKRDGIAPNAHVYDMCLATRHMVAT